MTPATDRLADKIIILPWIANPSRDHMEWSQQPNMKYTPAFARGANSIGAGSGVKNLREWRGSKQALNTRPGVVRFATITFEGSVVENSTIL